eukprot:6214628-Pleurochrysis_carterae.AAC.3
MKADTLHYNLVDLDNGSPRPTSSDCAHQGKTLGTRGVRDMKTSDYSLPGQEARLLKRVARRHGLLRWVLLVHRVDPGTTVQLRAVYCYTQWVAVAVRTNLGVPSIRYRDARAQPELAEELQRWAEKAY